MITLAALAAFIREHEYCGELDSGLEDDRPSGYVLVRGGDPPNTGASGDVQQCSQERDGGEAHDRGN